jgi:uncharacterized protein involved in exopolysaccharide biosynthesis
MAAENRVALASAGGKLSSINQQLSSEKDGFVADSPLIQQYKVKLAEAEVQLVALKQQYTEQHPQVLAVKATIAETRAKLQAEAERIVSADAPSTNPIHQELLRGKIHSEAEMSAAAAQQGAIHKAIADSNNDLRQMPAKEQGLAKVMRDAAVAQEIYIMLAKRHEEARITEARGATDVQLIDAATLPEKPIKPDKLLYITVAALIGLLSSLGIVFIREYLSNTICNERDVKRYLDLTVLGNIPDYKNTEKVSVTSLWKKITRRDTAKKHRGS